MRYATHCVAFPQNLIILSWVLAFLFTGTVLAQETKTIKGIVKDAAGEPLIGASVVQKIPITVSSPTWTVTSH